MSEKIPTFYIETPAKENFDKYNEYMRNAKTMDDVKRCRLRFEGCLQACTIHDRERKRTAKEEVRESVSFAVGE